MCIEFVWGFDCRHDELDSGGYLLRVAAGEWGEEGECGGRAGGEHEEEEDVETEAGCVAVLSLGD